MGRDRCAGKKTRLRATRKELEIEGEKKRARDGTLNCAGAKLLKKQKGKKNNKRPGAVAPGTKKKGVAAKEF